MDRTLSLPLLITALVSLTGAAPATSDLTLKLDGLRNTKGTVRVCLTSDSVRFLECQKVPGAVGRSVAAGQAREISLGRVPAGTYALLVIHDENNNGKFDMTFGIPREGFGFSNNPAMRPRPPRWDEIRFALPGGPVTETIRVRYVL